MHLELKHISTPHLDRAFVYELELRYFTIDNQLSGSFRLAKPLCFILTYQLMIKFFRQIRQRMLSENKFSKYLIYAIGEIVLVMIGILLALQVNNWNQERSDREKVWTYLEQIEEEIALDIQGFDTRFTQVDEIICYLDKLDSGKYDEINLTLLNHFLARNLTALENGYSFNKLRESGKIDLIEQSQMLDQLQAYYLRDRQQYNEIASFHKKFVSENIEGPLLQKLSIKRGFISDPEEVIQAMETGNLRSMVNWQISFLDNGRPLFEKVKAQAEALAKSLEAERTRSQ